MKLTESIQDRIFLGDDLNGLLMTSCQLGNEEKARRYAIHGLDHVIQLRHRAELPENFAALAYFLVHFGDRRQALDVWRLANNEPMITNSIWYQDVVGSTIAERTKDLMLPDTPGDVDADLWNVAESLLEQLG